MSSLRNSAPRRPHRERSQPSARAKWGLLEKHKDYSLRAADYNAKKKKISVLDRKAREKHPDEFAYGMLSDGGKIQGRHGQGGTEHRLSHDAVKLLKTQDQGYLRVVMARTRKEVDRVKEQLAGVEGEGKRVVFEEDNTKKRRMKKMASGGALEGGNSEGEADGDEVQGVVDAESGQVAEEGASEEEVRLAARPKPTRTSLAADNATAATRLRAERKKRRRLQEARATKLEMLRRRQKEIMAAADQLELQRAKMAKTVGGVNKNGVKFKIRERKK
ncbi:hypothetical protein DV736_g5673, partial [Chaetothyriales sp. CBS 134916]